MSTAHHEFHRTLADLVEAVPGVRGLEPGVVGMLRTVDARLRRTAGRAPFGLVVEPDRARVTIEVGIDHHRPVRDVVAEIQRVVGDAVRGVLPEGTAVVVRVQSVRTGSAAAR